MAPPGETPSNNLWVGNLAPDVTDADLTSLFQKYGQLDSVTAYSSRGFGFLYFKNINDSKEAKDALQGSFFHGNPLRIEFAKPAKPCKSLWVAGISKSVSKEELEDQFKGFGKIQEYKFIRDRNTAYIDFARLEDAAEALKNMNGKKFGGEQIRVDYLRSQPTRREQGPEFREMRDGQYPNRNIGHPDTRLMPQDFGRNYSDPMHAGFRRQHPFQLPVGQGHGQPSKVLCITYPPSVHVDEDMLHNAMILFGEINGIKTFYDRNFSLVEFRSVEEAQRAKEGLQGKLFNDPRITIEYSSSGPAPGRDFLEYHPSIIGPTTDSYPNENPFQPAHMGMFGHNRPMLASNVPGRLPPYGIHGPDIPARPLGMQGRFEPVISGPEFTDLPVASKLQDTSPHNVMGGPNWKPVSPTPGVLSSPSGEQKPPSRSAIPGWDVFDSSQLQRETKRSRIDGAYDSSYPHKRTSDRGPVLDEQYGLGPFGSNVPSGPVTVSRANNSVSPLDARISPGQSLSGHDYIWRGTIAKGGTPVCHARCVPIGESIESEIPEVVNCSARTGLDMLTKHYADAVGFNIVYFLPDSEKDFASYTEFLRYLGSKDRAGVAKFANGTTLFLVPPSDFLTKVLKVVGPKRLYGVVLKFAHHIPSATSLPAESNQPQYVDAPRMTSSQAAYDAMPSMERVPQMNYDQVTREDVKLPSKEYGSLTAAYPTNTVQPSNSAAYPSNPVHQSNTAAPSQAGISLTPELIATLAKMLPANQLPSVEGATMPAGASAGMSASDVALAPGKVQQQSWRYDQQAPGQAADHMFGSHFNNQTQVLSQLQAHPQVLNAPNHYSQGATSFSQMQDHNLNLQAQGGPPQTLTSTIISQGTQLSAQPHVDRQLQLGRHQDAASGSGIAHGTDALGHYGSSVPQQQTNLASLTNQTHGANVSQPQAGMPVASGMGLATQMQQLQSALYGSVQEGSESEVDKNERYQATLLFAASLLSKIHNQKPSSQSGQGSDNH
ncbi:flowering time control protein FPA [Solanum dulcamara]|uniref:flowering time control protein FPA n=1 Tax=Solanum dulcamara TaxID=45834 RepID=UPI002484F16E|nr:flowering time control protein FPA [Solanum dulcamara]